jgi:DNA-binding NarL/FixJ family response regulator
VTENSIKEPGSWQTQGTGRVATPVWSRQTVSDPRSPRLAVCRSTPAGHPPTNRFARAMALQLGSTPLVKPMRSTQESGSAPSTDCPRHETRILIVDDCTLFRETLAAVLTADDAVATSVAWDLRSLRAAFEDCMPKIVLLSTSTRDSAALLHATIDSTPDAKVIAVGVSEDDEPTIVACAEAGVTGYHLRSESLDDLLQLIRKVTHGESACSPRVAPILLRRLSMLAAERQPGPKELVLTAREIEILRMLEMGLSNRDIADQLCIALHTVKNHVHSVLGKLGVSTRAQAVAFARSLQCSEVHAEGSRHGTGPKMAPTVHIRPGRTGLIVDQCDAS